MEFRVEGDVMIKFWYFATIISFALYVLSFAWLIIVILTGCLPDREDCGSPGTMRCHDNVAEICTADGEWMADDNCSAVTLWDGTVEEWECCTEDGAAFCDEVCE